MAVIIEGSEVKAPTLAQLKTRLRNLAATTQKMDKNNNPIFNYTARGVPVPALEHDWRKLIVESNPDGGWIKTDILLVSDQIYKYGEIRDSYVQIDEDIDPATSSHIASSSVNEFLPKTFIQDNMRNKPSWWVSRYLFGSFMYSEGLVYPSAMSHIEATFEPPAAWRRLIAFDYGLVDPSVFLFGAVDPKKGILHIYKEVRTNDKNIEQLAQLFFKNSSDIPVGGLICQPIIDPKSGPRRDYDKKTLADHFLDYGIVFKPGAVNMDARLFRTNTYFECGRLKIMDCCKYLISELREHKFASDPNAINGYKDKPEDKNDHSISALEWICMELPADPRKLTFGIYNKEGIDLTAAKEVKDEDRYGYSVFDDPEPYTSEAPFGIDIW